MFVPWPSNWELVSPKVQASESFVRALPPLKHD